MFSSKPISWDVCNKDHGTAVESLPSVLKALGSIPNIKKETSEMLVIKCHLHKKQRGSETVQDERKLKRHIKGL